MKALIDGDVVVYRTAWASEDVEEGIACWRANETVETILRETVADEYEVWLSDSLENNYRLKVDPKYKISRQDQPKPKWYHSIKSFLQREWNAQITVGQEADDILSITQCGTTNTVICSIDKDLLQVPGKHYNWVKKEWFEQTYFEGLKHFYSQLLIGDRVDDIVGVHGLGPVKTEKLLGSLQTEQELFEKVRYQYKDDERLLKNGRLLWVRRKPNEMWEFPVETRLYDESGEPRCPTHGDSDGEPPISGSILHG